MAILNITTRDEFKENVLDNKKLVLIDFWATWCPPCRMMAPILEELSKKMDSELDIVKIDIEASDDNKAISTEHEVQGIPNLQIYKNGEVVDQLVGMRQANVLEDDIKKHL